jgi:hypothetical protein
MKIYLLSFAILRTSNPAAYTGKDSLDSRYDLLPDPFREQVKDYQEEYGDDANYHKARMILLLTSLILMLLQNRSHSYLIRYAVWTSTGAVCF